MEWLSFKERNRERESANKLSRATLFIGSVSYGSQFTFLSSVDANTFPPFSLLRDEITKDVEIFDGDVNVDVMQN